MPRFKVTHLSDANTLRRMNPDSLFRVIEAGEQYFRGRLAAVGVDLVRPADEDDPVYARLATAISEPTAEMPADLAHLICSIDELASHADELRARCELHDEEGAPRSSEDIAVTAWFDHKRVAFEVLARAQLQARRAQQNYTFFRQEGTLPLAKEQVDVVALEAEFAQLFGKNGRSYKANAHFIEADDELWVVVRHGATFRREGVVGHASMQNVAYFPVHNDVIAFGPGLRHVRLNVEIPKCIEPYLAILGRTLFTSPGATAMPRRFTLDPLKGDLEHIVSTDGFSKMINRVRLVYIKHIRGGVVYTMQRTRSLDLVQVLKSSDLLRTTTLLEARFELLLEGEGGSGPKRPRTVSVEESNVTKFTRDEEARLCEAWLEARGFVADAA